MSLTTAYLQMPPQEERERIAGSVVLVARQARNTALDFTAMQKV